MSTGLLLRLWIGLTGLAILGAFTWEFVPVLIPAIAVALGFGGVSAGMIALARWLERTRNRS